MNCCTHCEDAGRFFDTRTAEKELRKYRKKGPPDKSTRMLIDALRELDLHEKTLLDIGGGVGMIQHELMEEGLAHSMGVDASRAYLAVAEQEAARRGYAERSDFRYGDVVEVAPELPTFELVTLDRVICCYPHMERLVKASTGKAGRWYGVVVPKERWYLRAGVGVTNLYCRLRKMDFRVYVHEGVEEAIEAQGFSPIYRDTTFLWKVLVYERNGKVEDRNTQA